MRRTLVRLAAPEWTETTAPKNDTPFEFPARLGRKGHLYGPRKPPPPPSPKEKVRITVRRIQKAERDERVDITMSLTPVKTYMGGFTRPRGIRASNWFPGGAYLKRGKVYENPAAEAYVPHSVYLLESRYDVKYGIGRADTKEHVMGMCRADTFPWMLRWHNSARAKHKIIEAMDNAKWPWFANPKKPAKWWKPGELKEMGLSGIMKKQGSEAVAGEEGEEEYDDAWEQPQDESSIEVEDSSNAELPPTNIELPPDSMISAEVSTEQLSDPAQVEEDSVDDMPHPGGLHNSSTPASQPQDAELLPHPMSFAEISIEQLSNAAPSEGDSIDDIPHPADLQNPPTPVSRALKAELPPDTMSAEISHGQLSNAIDDMPRPGDLRNSPGPEPRAPLVRQPLPHLPLGDTSSLDPKDDSSQQPKSLKPTDADKVRRLRERYFAHMQTHPFFRPMLVITVPTRPLAATILRLSKSHPRGLPFYASVSNDDRKASLSFSGRMREMRIRRIRGLTLDVARRLRGERGGFIGMRFGPEDLGRAIGGEGLEYEWQGKVKVAIGSWQKRVEEEMAIWREEDDGVVVDDQGVVVRTSLDVVRVDDWGYELNEKGERLSGQDTEGRADQMEDEDDEDGDDDDEGDDDDDNEPKNAKGSQDVPRTAPKVQKKRATG